MYAFLLLGLFLNSEELRLCSCYRSVFNGVNKRLLTGYRVPFEGLYAFNSEQLIPIESPYDNIIESLRTIAVSGFLSKEFSFSEPFIFTELFEKKKWKRITAVTDDIAFARKRLTSPSTVYSGLIENLHLNQAANDLKSLQNIVSGNDAWLGFNISHDKLIDYAQIAANSSVKRVVFGINIQNLNDTSTSFDSVTEVLEKAGILYTLVKYGPTTAMAESNFPYRISNGSLPIPSAGEILATQDLYRVLLETLDLAKSFNQVYGVGSGGQLDREVLVYMKSQGWSERVQVTLLLDGFMDKSENDYKISLKKRGITDSSFL